MTNPRCHVSQHMSLCCVALSVAVKLVIITISVGRSWPLRILAPVKDLPSSEFLPSEAEKARLELALIPHPVGPWGDQRTADSSVLVTSITASPRQGMNRKSRVHNILSPTCLLEANSLLLPINTHTRALVPGSRDPIGASADGDPVAPFVRLG